MLSLTSAVVKTSPAASCPVAAASKLGPERSTIGLPSTAKRKNSKERTPEVAIHSELRTSLQENTCGGQEKHWQPIFLWKDRNQLNESSIGMLSRRISTSFILCFFVCADELEKRGAVQLGTREPLCLPSAKAASQTLQPGRDAVVVSHLSAIPLGSKGKGMRIK